MDARFLPDKKIIKGTSLTGAIEAGCPTQVEVNDGRITRIRPYHYDEKFSDCIEANTWKIEARGKTFKPPSRSLPTPFGLTYKKRVYSENRVRWPLKRVDWDPNGERNPQNRGKSKYVRISWDEAAQLVADELLRVKERHGIEAVLVESDGHSEGKHIAPAHGCVPRLLAMLGPYTYQMRNMDSWEGWHLGARLVWGCEPFGEMMPSSNIYPDIAKHSDMLLFWGCDPETTPLGMVSHMPGRLCNWFTEIGIRSVFIDPALNYAAAIHADKWIPVLPNTDAALQLAIAYIWLTEETYDKKYIDTHAYGFEKFADYVLGREDGEPKTPEWASGKCGVPEWTIKALARDWASKTVSILHGNGGCFIRGPYASEPARLEVMLLGMRSLGKPGVHQGKMIEFNLGGQEDYPIPYQSSMSAAVPVLGIALLPAAGDFDPDMRFAEGRVSPEVTARSPRLAKLLKFPGYAGATIPRCLIHRAILEPHLEWYGMQLHPVLQLPEPDGTLKSTSKYLFRKIEFPRPGKSRVHMIWTDSPCQVTCWNDGNMMIRAFQSPDIECIVSQHPWLENDCYFADLILPVATKYEMADLGNDPSSLTFNTIFPEDKCVEPIGESLSDFRVCAKVAEKLGGDYFDRYTGNYTDEELIKMFYETTDASSIMDWDEFSEKQMCLLPLKKGVEDVPAGLYKFYSDQENHPLTTPTGKLEYSSTEIEEHMPDDKERPPVPQWIEKGPSHDERLSGERAAKYPLLCVSNHGRWRMHAQLDDVTWNREIETMKIRAKDGYQYEPVWLHPSEALKRGIVHGDIVKVFNERGIVLCGAYVTERLVTKTCYIDHGARLDPIIPGALDRGGAINTITPSSLTSKNSTGMAVSGFLVEVEKVTDSEMDHWKHHYPEAFSRCVDHAAGVCLDGWLSI